MEENERFLTNYDNLKKSVAENGENYYTKGDFRNGI